MAVVRAARDMDDAAQRTEIVRRRLRARAIVGAKHRAAIPQIARSAPDRDHDHRIEPLRQWVGSDAALEDLARRNHDRLARCGEGQRRAVIVADVPFARDRQPAGPELRSEQQGAIGHRRPSRDPAEVKPLAIELPARADATDHRLEKPGVRASVVAPAVPSGTCGTPVVPGIPVPPVATRAIAPPRPHVRVLRGAVTDRRDDHEACVGELGIVAAARDAQIRVRRLDRAGQRNPNRQGVSRRLWRHNDERACLPLDREIGIQSDLRFETFGTIRWCSNRCLRSRRKRNRARDCQPGPVRTISLITHRSPLAHER